MMQYFTNLMQKTESELYTGTASILYTQVTSIHYQRVPRKDKTWKIDISSLPVYTLQSLLLLFLDKHDESANKNK